MTPHEKKVFQHHVPENLQLYKGAGCEECLNTGYKGRVGIFEVITFDEDFQEAVIQNASPTEILALIHQKNIKNLLESGVSKLLAGETTPEEILRVVGS